MTVFNSYDFNFFIIVKYLMELQLCFNKNAICIIALKDRKNIFKIKNTYKFPKQILTKCQSDFPDLYIIFYAYADKDIKKKIIKKYNNLLSTNINGNPIHWINVDYSELYTNITDLIQPENIVIDQLKSPINQIVRLECFNVMDNNILTDDIQITECENNNRIENIDKLLLTEFQKRIITGSLKYHTY